MTSTKTRSVLLSGALAGGSIVVAFVVAEVILRIIGFRFALFPTEVQFGWPDPRTLQDVYQVDKTLLWVPKNYYPKVESWRDRQPAIVFMGCSCTEFGRYDSSLDELVLRQYPTNSLTFVNVGVGGWSSYQGLQQLKRDVLPMKPRTITIYYGWNDHWCSFGIEDKAIAQLNTEFPTLLLTLSRSRVVQLVNATLFKIRHSLIEGGKRRPERVSLSDFTSNLTQMVRIARENHITPILMTAPTSHTAGAEPAYLATQWLNDLHDLVPLHQQYLQAVRDVAASEHAPLIDLYAEFRSLDKDDWHKYFQDDGIHLTRDGNRKIAEIMFEHFRTGGLMDRLVDTGTAWEQ